MMGKTHVFYSKEILVASEISESSTKPIYVPGGYSANARTVTNIPNLLMT